MINRVLNFVKRLLRAAFGEPLKTFPLYNGCSVVSRLDIEKDRLYRIDLLITTYGRTLTAEKDSYISLSLFEEYSPVPLVECVVSLSSLKYNRACTFLFAPLPDGYKGKTLVVSIAARYSHGQVPTIGVYCTRKRAQKSGYCLYEGRILKVVPAWLPFYQDENERKVECPLVSIIIVNYNGLKYIGECLRSVTRQDYPNCEVIVVDNASSDGSSEFIAKEYPSVRLLRLPQNIEFVRANNHGLQVARGQYIALLNPDVWVPPDFVAKMVDVLESNVQAGGAGCIINTLGSLTRYASVFLTPDGLVGGPSAVNIDVEEPVFCLAPCGAAAMYRRAALDRMSEFLDEEFVSDWEDHDLGYRLNLLGYPCIHVPSVEVRHIGSAAYGVSAKRQARIYRNMLLTYFKNMELKSFIWAFLQVLLAPKPAASVLGIASFLKTITLSPEIRNKRRVIQQQRRVSDAYLRFLTGRGVRWKV
ncbi:MAG: glycosyltransferase family 2 protein [Candidatus Methanosuratincola sp.]